MITTLGCVGAPFIDHLAGVPLTGAPHFHHIEVFLESDELYVALDPYRHPTYVGKTYSIYVVKHKDYAQWDADPFLIDVTGTVETATLNAGTLLNNQTLAWPAMLPSFPPHTFHIQYDVVFDFGNDGKYHKNDDILDRIGVLERPYAEESGGFTLMRDPATGGDFPVSEHEYNAGSYTVSVPAQYHEPGDPLTIDLKGILYYPATSTGIDQPINPDFASYPLIIIAHGRHGTPDSYLGYEYLGRHLASRGFICASVALHELVSGWRIHHRGLTILKHITTVLVDPTSDAVIMNLRPSLDKERIGLMGHSRGGEGVVAAQEVYSNMSPLPVYTIKAVAAFSPTDGKNWSETTPGSGPYDPVFPYMMIYGTRDGDVNGYGGNTGFRTVDRGVRPRNMFAIYGANHNFFNETWPSDGSPTIGRSQQETLAKALVTPFFSDHLFEQQAYAELLSGFVVPDTVSGVATTILYGDQPERWIHLTVDDSENAPLTEATNSLTEQNFSVDLDVFIEEELRYQTVPERNYYTHDTRGLRAAWKTSSGYVRFVLKDLNVRIYDYLSFRVGQRFRAVDNLNALNAPQSLSITLTDTLGHCSPPIIVSIFTSIPYTDDVGNYTKSIMHTVRIPLRAFTANGSPLDLNSLNDVKFAFDRSWSGELIFDDLEFLGLDISEPD